MNIQHKDDGKKGAFYIESNGQRDAEMTYRHTGDQQITVDHTEVKDTLKGQGVGHQLITNLVTYLRNNNLKAVPQCPFVKSVFEKDPQKYGDVKA